jgi:hypothetical protein
MRVAWNESDNTWLARIGPCYVSLRQMDWYDAQAREHRETLGPPGLKIGTMVFDQSLGLTGRPIWWDGTQWVDATGAPA